MQTRSQTSKMTVSYLSCGGKFTHFAFVKKLECVNCGDLYHLNEYSLDENFCSEDCDYEYHGLQANCGGCGNSYPIEGDDTGYCCVECEEDTMHCENCGKPGTMWLEERDAVGAVFCSEQCWFNY